MAETEKPDEQIQPVQPFGIFKNKNFCSTWIGQRSSVGFSSQVAYYN